MLCSWIVAFLGNQATAEEEVDVNAKAEVAVCQSAKGEIQQIEEEGQLVVKLLLVAPFAL